MVAQRHSQLLGWALQLCVKLAGGGRRQEGLESCVDCGAGRRVVLLMLVCSAACYKDDSCMHAQAIVSAAAAKQSAGVTARLAPPRQQHTHIPAPISTTTANIIQKTF